MIATDRFWATPQARRVDHQDPNADLDDLAAFYSMLAGIAEETLAELRALPLQAEADRARMDAFVPIAEQLIEVFRQEAAAAAAGDRARLDELGAEWWQVRQQDHLLPGCLAWSLGG